ncbi:hypothetical protein BVX99_02745, partial [bacterium F16]
MNSEKQLIQHYEEMEIGKLVKELDQSWLRLRTHMKQLEAAPSPTATLPPEDEDESFEFVLPDFPDDDDMDFDDEPVDSDEIHLNPITLDGLLNVLPTIKTISAQVKSIPSLVDICTDAEKLSSVNVIMEDEPFNILLLIEMFDNGKFTGTEKVYFDAKELLSVLELDQLDDDEISRIEKMEELKGENSGAPVEVSRDDDPSAGAWPDETGGSDAITDDGDDEDYLLDEIGGDSDGDDDGLLLDELDDEGNDDGVAALESGEPQAIEAAPSNSVSQDELERLFANPDSSTLQIEPSAMTDDEWVRLVPQPTQHTNTDDQVIFEKYKVDQDEINLILAGVGASKALLPTEELDQSEHDSKLAESFFSKKDEDDDPLSTMDMPAISVVKEDTVEQGELDALLSQDGLPTALEAFHNAESEADDDMGAVGQNEVDALLALQSDDAEAEADDDMGAVGQNEVDALLALQSGAAEPEADADMGAVGQNEIDALLALQSDAAEPEGDADTGAVGQNEIDALLALQSNAAEPEADADMGAAGPAE